MKFLNGMPMVGNVEIIDRGSNSYGNWIKYEDGTMVCWKSGLSESVLANQSNQIAWTLPMEFYTIPVGSAQAGWPASSWDTYGIIAEAATTTTFTVRYKNGATAQTINNMGFLVWGRWK